MLGREKYLLGRKEWRKGMGVEFQSQHYEKQGYYFLA